MPNWDRDFDDDANDFEPEEREFTTRHKRHLYGRTKPSQPLRMWNGNNVVQMETDHILNAIMFCEKKFADAKIAHSVCFPDSVNAFYFESPFDMFPEYVNLREEWDRRNEKS